MKRDEIHSLSHSLSPSPSSESPGNLFNRTQKISLISQCTPSTLSNSVEHYLPKSPSQSGAHRRGLTSIVLPPVANLTSNASTPSAQPRSSTQLLSQHCSSFVGSYFSSHPGASSDLEARSPPANKRPPASRSSHGIETFSGPPPALSTQRTRSTDNWRLTPAKDPHIVYPQLTPQALATLAAENLARVNTQESTIAHLEPPIKDELGSKSSKISSAEAADGVIFTAATKVPPPINLCPGHNTSDEKMSREPNLDSAPNVRHQKSESQSSQEDLFLNLATTDAPAEKILSTITPKERQPTQDATPEGRPQAMTFEDRETQQPLLQTAEGRFLTTFQMPVYKDRHYSASAHPLNTRHRSRLSGGAPNTSSNTSRLSFHCETSPESPQIYVRKPSVPESTIGIPSRAYRSSNLVYLTNGKHTPSPFTGRPTSKSEHDIAAFAPRAEGTESTVSTTAPSTVWDELDDLKSRIKKLELTGKIPSSSGAAISTATGERPMTATTTVTTISSSPKHDRGKTSVSPENAGEDSSTKVYPLLVSALAKTEALISPPMYKALEATASDAIALANITSGTAKGSVPSSIDRQLRRKADNMCRSLTELCIALTEEKSKSANGATTSRPGSQDTHLRQTGAGSADELKPYRSGIQEPEPITSSRVLSRLEARRSSVLVLGSVTNATSALREGRHEIPTPTQENTSPDPLARTSTVLQRLRRSTEADADKTIRPLSRAMTELNRSRPAARQASPREHSSQPPSSGGNEQRSPSVLSSLPVRRSYFPMVSQFPSTPVIQPGNRRYLERPSPLSADSVRLAEVRQQRLASLGQYPSAGRQRASSLSRRLRQSSLEAA